MRRAFALSGARNLLMSLWPVVDESHGGADEHVLSLVWTRKNTGGGIAGGTVADYCEVKKKNRCSHTIPLGPIYPDWKL